MNEFTSNVVGGLAIAVGISSILALILFLAGLFQRIAALSPTVGLNDTLNVLASVLYTALARILSKQERMP